MIPALAFVPVDHVVDVFEELSENVDGELQPVLDWLEDSYIGRQQRRRRRQPLFPVAMWNVHDLVVEHLARTNNHAEAAHRRIQSELQMEHPTIWKFIDGLKRVQK